MKLADRIEDWHYRLWHWFDQACANIILGPELSLDPTFKIPIDPDRAKEPGSNPGRVGAALQSHLVDGTGVGFPQAQHLKIPVSYDPPRTVPVTAGIPVETAVTAASPGASRAKDCDFHDDPGHECEDWWGDITSVMCRLSRTHRMLANFYAHHGRAAEDIIGGTKY